MNTSYITAIAPSVTALTVVFMNRYREYYKEYHDKKELREFLYTWVDLIKSPLIEVSERFEELAYKFKATDLFDFSMQRGDFLITVTGASIILLVPFNQST
jgi:hypothetical protein